MYMPQGGGRAHLATNVVEVTQNQSSAEYLKRNLASAQPKPKILKVSSALAHPKQNFGPFKKFGRILQLRFLFNFLFHYYHFFYSDTFGFLFLLERDKN